MDKQESILAEIQSIEDEIKALKQRRQTLVGQLDKLYYVTNIKLDAPIIVCHGTEEYCRQYMLDNYPLGHWYDGTTQFSPINNPKYINWAILHSVTRAEKRDWARLQAYIENETKETAWDIIAMLRGD